MLSLLDDHLLQYIVFIDFLQLLYKCVVFIGEHVHISERRGEEIGRDVLFRLLNKLRFDIGGYALFDFVALN